MHVTLHRPGYDYTEEWRKVAAWMAEQRQKMKRREIMREHFIDGMPGGQYDGETLIVLQERYGHRTIRKAIYWADSDTYVAVDGAEKGNKLFGITGWIDPAETYRAFGYGN